MARHLLSARYPRTAPVGVFGFLVDIMTSSKPKTASKCPICRGPVVFKELEGEPLRVVYNEEQRPPHAPFCSDRCRLVDLDRWLNESYRFSVQLGFGTADDEDESKKNLLH